MTSREFRWLAAFMVLAGCARGVSAVGGSGEPLATLPISQQCNQGSHLEAAATNQQHAARLKIGEVLNLQLTVPESLVTSSPGTTPAVSAWPWGELRTSDQRVLAISCQVAASSSLLSRSELLFAVRSGTTVLTAPLAMSCAANARCAAKLSAVNLTVTVS